MPSHNLYDHDKMEKLYAEYEGTPRQRWEKIAKTLGCNFITVRNVLKKRGIKMEIKWGGSRKHRHVSDFHREQVRKNKRIIRKHLEYPQYDVNQLQYVSSLSEYTLGQITYCIKLYRRGIINQQGERIC